MLNIRGQTFYTYSGQIKTSTDNSYLLSRITGMFKAQRAQNIENFNDYMNLIKIEQESLEKIYPQFKELRYTPEEGIYLFKNWVDNRYKLLVQNINRGQTPLEASVNAYFEPYEKLASSNYVTLVTTSSDLVKRGILSPGETKLLLEYATKGYNKYITSLNELRQQILSDLAKGNVDDFVLEAANLRGIHKHISLENLNRNIGKLPDTSFLDRVKLPTSMQVNIKTGDTMFGIQSVNFNLDNNFRKYL